MKRQKFMRLLNKAAALLCCATLTVSSSLISPASDKSEDETICIEIQLPNPSENGNSTYTPLDDDTPWGAEPE